MIKISMIYVLGLPFMPDVTEDIDYTFDNKDVDDDGDDDDFIIIMQEVQETQEMKEVQ